MREKKKGKRKEEEDEKKKEKIFGISDFSSTNTPGSKSLI